MDDQRSGTALVVGAGRGLGRGVAQALAAGGDRRVLTLSRTEPEPLEGAEALLGDAADPALPARLIDDHQPDLVVLVAGAVPHVRPIHEQTWETFSLHWHSDVKIVFGWMREVLLSPLPPSSRVIAFSSGAALAGSPLSGGYAGAKATGRFIADYARGEAARSGRDLTITTVLPRITALTEVGRSAARAYVRRSGGAAGAEGPAPQLTPEGAGKAVVELAGLAADELAPEYLLTAAGLSEVPGH